jgi:hypothetical protein
MCRWVFDRAGNMTDNFQAQRPSITPEVNLSEAITGDPTSFVNPAFFQLQAAGFYGDAPMSNHLRSELEPGKSKRILLFVIEGIFLIKRSAGTVSAGSWLYDNPDGCRSEDRCGPS